MLAISVCILAQVLFLLTLSLALLPFSIAWTTRLPSFDTFHAQPVVSQRCTGWFVHRASLTSKARKQYRIFMDVTDLIKPDDEDEHSMFKDGNGMTFKPDCCVRVIKQDCKAYQVNAKYRGSFDVKTKEFVPNATLKYLAVPVGLRGVVTKVYNVDLVHANFPIRVKFQRGQHTEEGYDTPSDFVMHFESDEIEVC
jgi:hypothetical protein